MDAQLHERLGRIEDALCSIGKALEKIAVMEERQANYKEVLTKFEGSVVRAHERIDAQEKVIIELKNTAELAKDTGKDLKEKLWEMVKTVLFVVIGAVLAKAGLSAGVL